MISEVARKSNWLVRGPLLVTMVLTVPVLFFAFLIAGFVSCGWLLMTMLPTLLFPFNIFALIYAIHVVAYGVPMYWLSGVVSRWICRHRGWKQAAILIVICVALLTVGAQPIFGVVSHGPLHGKNAYELLRNPMK